MALTPRHPSDDRRPHVAVNPLYGKGGELLRVPRDELPEGELAADLAEQIVRDELLLDGASKLNLATFVTTSMEPQARALMDACVDKNMIDKDEYPQTAELERRCVAMLARLWHAPGDPIGCSTTGSSEAAMLAGLALKRRWQHRRRSAGLDADRPNLVMGANVQVCWEKFANYWDVEPRLIPVEVDRLHLSPSLAAEACDERTIGVVGILGSTFDGSYEPIAELASVLDDLQERTGLDVPVHVDGASGAMVAPFLDPDLVWDFALPRVASINASGHKYGLVYPGVGWVVWRDEAALPDDLVFHVDYLGGDMPTFALNFSRPGAQVVAQYYCFLRLGREGYARVHQACRDVARHLATGVAELGPFELLTDGSELPVFAATTRTDAGFSVYDISRVLRERGWIVPAYPFPPNRTDLHALRFVVRNGFSHDLADLLLADLRRAIDRFGAGGQSGTDHPSFHH